MSIFIVSILSNSYYICFVYSFFYINVVFDNQNFQIKKQTNNFLNNFQAMLQENELRLSKLYIHQI